MIQRVQTIFLALIKIFAILFLFMPLGKVHIKEKFISISLSSIEVFHENADTVYPSWLRYLIIASVIIILIITLITIFSYKTRKKQLKLNQYNLLLHILMVAMTFLYIDFLKAQLEGAFSYGASIIFPLISLILLILASRAIKKDENLVRSVDRLR